MALPGGAAESLAKSMGDAGMTDGPADEGPDDGPDEDKVYKDICKDVFQAMKSGDEEQFCNFMLELLERYGSDEEAKEAPEPPAMPAEEA